MTLCVYVLVCVGTYMYVLGDFCHQPHDDEVRV